MTSKAAASFAASELAGESSPKNSSKTALKGDQEKTVPAPAKKTRKNAKKSTEKSNLDSSPERSVKPAKTRRDSTISLQLSSKPPPQPKVPKEKAPKGSKAGLLNGGPTKLSGASHRKSLPIEP